MQKGATHGFTFVYGLNKHKPMKNYIGGTSREEIKVGRPVGAHIPPFSGGNDSRSTGMQPNLACGPRICVEVWWNV